MEKQTGKRTIERKKKNSRKNRILVLFIFLIIFIISSILLINNLIQKNKAKTDNLIGLWDIDGNTKYEFNGKGTGNLIIPQGEYSFSYKISDKEIVIDFDNENSTDATYYYSLSDDVLTIENKNNSSLKYKMKKIDNK